MNRKYFDRNTLAKRETNTCVSVPQAGPNVPQAGPCPNCAEIRQALLELKLDRDAIAEKYRVSMATEDALRAEINGHKDIISEMTRQFAEQNRKLSERTGEQFVKNQQIVEDLEFEKEREIERVRNELETAHEQEKKFNTITIEQLRQELEHMKNAYEKMKANAEKINAIKKTVGTMSTVRKSLVPSK